MNSSGNDIEKWLIEAIDKNDLKEVQGHLDCGAYVDWRNGYGIFKAVEENNYELANVLVKNGSELNTYRDHNDEFPLTLAIDKGHFEIAKLFMENGADIGADNNKALRLATAHSLDALKLCESLGGNIHYNGSALLKHATCYGSIETMEYLIEKGQDIHQKGPMGNDCLSLAATSSADLAKVEFLLSKGADPNAHNDTISYPISMGQNAIVKALIEAGGDPTANNDNALYCAVRADNTEIINYLLIERKMPVSAETREWLEKTTDDHRAVKANHVLKKRDLNECLQQKYQRPPTQAKTKSQSFKI